MYQHLTDDQGRLVKTAAEIRGEVVSLLRQSGTSRAFADRIAAEMDGARSGNDLHACLQQEVASLPTRSPISTAIKPTRAAMDAAAEVIDSEPFLFSIRDSTPGIDLIGEVSEDELVFMVRAVLKGGSRGTLSGIYMFDRMLAHFHSQGTRINAIQGNWTYEANLGLFNLLVRVGLTLEEAASGTITGEWAGKCGYGRVTDVVVAPPTAVPGRYARVTAKFRQ